MYSRFHPEHPAHEHQELSEEQRFNTQQMATIHNMAIHVYRQLRDREAVYTAIGYLRALAPAEEKANWDAVEEAFQALQLAGEQYEKASNKALATDVAVDVENEIRALHGDV